MDNAFFHLQLLNRHLSTANLCITCEINESVVDFLNLVNKHNVGFICFEDGSDIIDEIERKSSAKNPSSTIEVEQISKDFIRKPNKFERAADTFTTSAAAAAAITSTTVSAKCTLFAVQVQLATSTTPAVPVVGNAINDNHL